MSTYTHRQKRFTDGARDVTSLVRPDGDNPGRHLHMALPAPVWTGVSLSYAKEGKSHLYSPSGRGTWGSF